MRPRLLILCQTQFGYHTDTYFYCKFLRGHFETTYLCWDYNREKQYLKNVDVIYVSRSGSIISRNIRYIFACINHLRKNNYDSGLIKYFRGCSILRMFCPGRDWIFDIRTGAVEKNAISRGFYNTLMRIEASVFPNVTIVSKSLAKKLFLLGKSEIVPLGAESIANNSKEFGSLKLLYVGTLANRNIEDTVNGFAKFYRQCQSKLRVSYTIIGSGHKEEEAKLRELVDKLDLNDVVNVLGYVAHAGLQPYFSDCNVGMSYVPITAYFDSQPVTKTFEYLLSGMPVIATATSENANVIDDENGVLIEDSLDGVYQGLREIWARRNTFSSPEIIQASQEYRWKNIVKALGEHVASIINNSNSSN